MDTASLDWGTGLVYANAYAAILLIALIDATGIPFPGRLLLIGAGAFAATGRLEVAPLIGAGAAGALLGDHLWYFAGRWRGETLLDLACRWLPGRRLAKARARELLSRHGAMAFVIGRFVAGVRMLASLGAGSGIGYLRFLLFDSAGALVWAGLFVLFGYAAGAHAPGLVGKVGLWTGLAIGGLLLACGTAAFLLWRRRRNARAGTALAARGGSSRR